MDPESSTNKPTNLTETGEILLSPQMLNQSDVWFMLPPSREIPVAIVCGVYPWKRIQNEKDKVDREEQKYEARVDLDPCTYGAVNAISLVGGKGIIDKTSWKWRYRSGCVRNQ
jgi:hypothetical protein